MIPTIIEQHYPSIYIEGHAQNVSQPRVIRCFVL